MAHSESSASTVLAVRCIRVAHVHAGSVHAPAMRMLHAM
jgi:hypothetical protein